MRPQSGGVELVLDARASLGEGPHWWSERGILLWVDIDRSLVHLWDPRSGLDRALDVGSHVGAVVPRAGGGLLAAVRDGFASVDPDTGRVELLVPVEADDASTRMNDAKCDPAGRLWAGTLADDERPGGGTLYRLAPGLDLRAMVRHVTCSNGLGWSPAGDMMYYIDSLAHGVDAFDFDLDRGEISRRRRLVDVAPEDGLPDGMTVDADGFIWVALWGGYSVRRYSPAGRLDGVIVVPVRNVTSCAFGGEGLADLFVTSAAQLETAAADDSPEAGGLFRCRPGVRGLPGTAFAG